MVQPRAGASSDRPLSRVAFEQEAVGWRETANVRRLLGLGFALVASVMKECAKAVESPAYMAIAKDLLNTLLPPISIFLCWLQLHPWFLQPAGTSSTAAATIGFVRETATFLRSVSLSLLADRILDEDLAQMSAKVLPEDRELAGFLPVELREAREADVSERGDDDVLLDIRLCRVLSFLDGFVRLEQTLHHEQDESVEDTGASYLELLASDAEENPNASESDSLSSESSSVQAAAPTEEEEDDNDDDEAESTLSAVRAAATDSSFAPQPTPDTRQLGNARAASRSKAGAKQRSPPRDHREAQDESLGFAAVMAIGADKQLFDASRTPPSATSRATNNTTTPTERKCLIVVDAANVAMRHGQHRKFSCVGIRMACDYYLQRGHRVVGFLPDFLLDADQVAARQRLASAGSDVPAAKLPDDVPLLQSMVDEGLLVPTPSQDYDDSYCIQYAGMYDGCVVTNDMYRDHIETMSGPRERKAAMRGWLVAHLISFTWVRNDFLPNPNFRYSGRSCDVARPWIPSCLRVCDVVCVQDSGVRSEWGRDVSCRRTLWSLADTPNLRVFEKLRPVDDSSWFRGSILLFVLASRVMVASVAHLHLH